MTKRGKYTVLSLSVFVAFLLFVLVSDPQEVRWEIVDSERTAEYIGVLDENSIPWTEVTDHLGKKYIVTEGYTVEELDELTKDNHR